ncbi:MAG: eukaryotic-like serine/threonine-protein kinase [Thermoleophilaceae bacterium]|nr:eukaryotic-like serine/threonine-protein kinase [Thermoleophilaceae bacterium]
MSSLGAGATLCEGRYRLDGILGRGGMAIVWKATDQQLERVVAIKVISDVLASDPSFVARFEREARLAAGLNHPNLVKVFDFSVDSERPFLIMEYVPGGTLVEASGRALDAEALARELLDAVAHIHAAGILHRDIKPANVLLGAEGSPRLTDFGIARSEETSGLTQTGQVLGTLRYIAPEVAAGEPSTPQSDLYSLGVLLGEIAGDSQSPSLAALLRRLSAEDPAARPGSATEALTELDPTTALDPTKPLDQARGLPPFTDVSFTSERGQTPWLGGGGSRVPLRAVGAGVAVVGILLLVLVLALSGGKHNKLDITSTTTSLTPAPAGAPVDAQLDQLEKIVRAAPRKR